MRRSSSTGCAPTLREGLTAEKCVALARPLDSWRTTRSSRTDALRERVRRHPRRLATHDDCTLPARHEASAISAGRARGPALADHGSAARRLRRSASSLQAKPMSRSRKRRSSWRPPTGSPKHAATARCWGMEGLIALAERHRDDDVDAIARLILERGRSVQWGGARDVAVLVARVHSEMSSAALLLSWPNSAGSIRRAP